MCLRMSSAKDLRSRLTRTGVLPGALDIDIMHFKMGKNAMGLSREQEVEIRNPPRFMPGERVRATRHIKNDGTYPGKAIGENLVRKGDEGYVRDIGTFLQQFYIYAVEWVDRGTVVGMRARELTSVKKAATVLTERIAK